MKMWKLLIFLIIGLNQSLAQDASNPFELKHRLNTPQKSEIDTPTNEGLQQEQESISAQVDTPYFDDQSMDGHNPFEIKARGRKKAKEEEITIADTPNETPVTTKPKGKGLSSSSLFWFLLFLTLLFAVIINLNRSIILHLLKAWSNLNFSNLLLRDKNSADRLLYTLLAVVFYCSAGLFWGLVMDRFFGIPLTALNLLGYIGGIVAVYIIRHLSLYWLANTFSFSKEAKQYSFTIHIFNILSGVLLLLCNFIIVFSPEKIGTGLIYIVLGILMIQFLYRNIRGLLLSANYIIGDRVHFFLYLCTCEIVPWVLCFVTISRMG